MNVVSIEPLGKAMRLYDITTGTEDFIANGVVSHNCYARPSHAYVGLSPGLDFETKLFYKADAARLLEKELAAPNYKCAPIMLGANTDPYQPIEKTLQSHAFAARSAAAMHSHPVTITTKGALVARDVDLLAELARDGLMRVMFSIPTLNNDMKRVLEPRAASAAARLKAMRVLADAGVPVGRAGRADHSRCSPSTKSRACSKPPRGRRVGRRLHNVAASLGGERPVPRVAGRAFPRPRGARHVDRAQHAWRARQRPRVRDAHARHRARGAADPAALSSSPAGGSAFPRSRRISLPTNLFRPPLRTHPQLSLDLAP